MNTNANCRVCGSDYYDKALLSYNNMPSSAQGFPELGELENDNGSSLNVFQCSTCGLVQLNNNPVPYYKEVIRASAFSDEMKELFKDLPEALGNNFNLPYRCNYRPLPSKPILPNISR